MKLLHRELHQLYQAFSRGEPSPLPELPIRYTDFVHWQRGYLQGEVLQKQVAFWKEALAGAPTILELPTDKPRPAVQSFRGATEAFALPDELLERLNLLSRQQDATLFMTLAAAFMALLHRFTGQTDILVGTPISTRTRSETEDLIGLFLNLVVLRTQFRDQESFQSLLQQVRQRAVGAYGHQDLPFEQLVTELAPERDLSHAPLFQVMFVLFNADAAVQTSDVAGLSQLTTGTSKFDLTLAVSETEAGLRGSIEYRTDLFEVDTIRRLCGHYETLLKAITRDPAQIISALPILSPAAPNGKIDRRTLHPPSSDRVQGAPESVAPRTETEKTLATIWSDVLKVERIGIQDNFFDLGGHSLLAAKLKARIEKAFGRTLPLAAMFQGPTIQHLAAIISEQRKLEVIPGIVPIHPVGSMSPFFCVGAGPLFGPLAQRLGPDQPFLGLVLEDEDLQNLPTRFKLEDMAAVFARRMREIQPAGPYFLGGWCNDGVLAYETAQRLLAQDQTVALLVLFDAYNPNPIASDSGESEWRRVSRRIRHHHFKNLRRMTMPEQLDYLLHRLRTRAMFLKYVSWEVFYKLRLHATDNFKGLFRNSRRMVYVAVRHYRPPTYPGPVLLIQTERPLEAIFKDPEMGWGKIVPQGLEIYSASGGHQGMFEEPHVDTLANKLSACLVEAQAPAAGSRAAAL